MHKKTIIYFAAGVFTLLAGVFCAVRGVVPFDSNVTGTFDSSENDRTQSDTTSVLPTPEEKLCIYICGAVKVPGVYYLSPGSRVCDALDAAGGATDEAQLNVINLADYVCDGQKIYVPCAADTAGGINQDDGYVNINTAGVSELITLPGIGESRAKDIIAYRTQNGPFASIEDIMKVPGIKEAAFGKIKDMICT